jgi:hypothetical protein
LNSIIPRNGFQIASSKVPVMYRLLEISPASPKNSRHPARASAYKAALIMGMTGRDSLQ